MKYIFGLLAFISIFVYLDNRSFQKKHDELLIEVEVLREKSKQTKCEIDYYQKNAKNKVKEFDSEDAFAALQDLKECRERGGLKIYR